MQPPPGDGEPTGGPAESRQLPPLLPARLRHGEPTSGPAESLQLPPLHPAPPGHDEPDTNTAESLQLPPLQPQPPGHSEPNGDKEEAQLLLELQQQQPPQGGQGEQVNPPPSRNSAVDDPLLSDPTASSVSREETPFTPVSPSEIVKPFL